MICKKKKARSNQAKIILGMVILQDDKSFLTEYFKEDLATTYGLKIIDPHEDSGAFAFTIEGQSIMIGHMPIPIPKGDIEGTAKYAYNWDNAVDDLKNHQSHLIVSIVNGGNDQIKRFKIFTQVISTLLRLTNSLGVYKGNQSLLISKDDYLTESVLMSSEYLPLNLWIYFGYSVTEHGNNCYTYGLKEFGKTEMEIIDSSRSIEEISKLMFNMTHYVLDYDVTFKDGQTCGMSVDEVIPIIFSKGKFLDGDTFKLAY
jgi:hypothetical protein